MFVTPNDDGTHTIVFNSRFTREQLLKDVPHEFVHILKNHFQDDRNVADLEAEANGRTKEPALPVLVPTVPKIPHYLTLRGLTLGELNASESLLTFGMENDAAKIRAAFLQALMDDKPLVVR